MTLNVIFGLNGAMIDDSVEQYQAWKAFFQRRGISLPKESHKGRSNDLHDEEMIGRLPGNKPEEIRKIINEKEEIYRKICTPILIEGLLGFLEALKREGVPMAIATKTSPETVAFIMDHLKVIDYFEYIVDDAQIHSAGPSLYIEAANRLGADPKHCVVFEKSSAGLASAKKAGMKVIRIASGAPGKDSKAISDYTTITPADLRKLIR